MQIVTHPQERFTLPHTRVLIIEDDVETATMTHSIFHNLGCLTSFALNPADAKHAICSGKTDLILLDWYLAPSVTAADVIQEAVQMIGKFPKLSRQLMSRHPKVVTYSSVPLAEIKFPANPFFQHIDHWEKPLRYLDLTKRSVDVLVHEKL